MSTSKSVENFDLGDGSGFTYSAAVLDFDEAPEEMTLVALATDTSSSVRSFSPQLLAATKAGVLGLGDACPHVNQLWIRQLRFNHEVEEQHGFQLFSDIDENADFPTIDAGGGTALYDATLEAFSVMGAEASRLNAEDVMANGILIVVTDGRDEHSSSTIAAVAAKLTELVDSKSRVLESLKVYLVGVNAASCQSEHESFIRELGLNPDTDYKLIEDFNEKTAGQLAGWISRSVSAQAAAAGTGGPSANVEF